jgi:hypothetical protein
MTEICFDSFVVADNDKSFLTSYNSGTGENKDCKYYAKNGNRTGGEGEGGGKFQTVTGITDSTPLSDPISLANPAEGCCQSNDRLVKEPNKGVKIIKTVDDLNSYIKKLKTDYQKVLETQIGNIFKVKTDSEYPKEYIITIYDHLITQSSETDPSNAFKLGREEITKNSVTPETKDFIEKFNKINIQLRRLFLGVENDLEKMKKMTNDLDNLSPLLTGFSGKDTNISLQNFSDKEKKLQYFDKSNYHVYESFFYTMLTIVSVLFVRTQINK